MDGRQKQTADLGPEDQLKHQCDSQPVWGRRSLVLMGGSDRGLWGRDTAAGAASAVKQTFTSTARGAREAHGSASRTAHGRPRARSDPAEPLCRVPVSPGAAFPRSYGTRPATAHCMRSARVKMGERLCPG